MFTIGKLAALAGTTPNTLRFYERKGLMPAPLKAENGYRLYPPGAAQTIHFIRQAQQCGFTLSEIRQLLALPQQSAACCSDVRELVVEKKLAIEAKIEQMKRMSVELDRLADGCPDNARPVNDCPILNTLNRRPAVVPQ